MTSIALIGPGAIGGMVAARLCLNPTNKVTIAARSEFGELVLDAPDGVHRANLSVLTEPSRFDGELAHLEAVVAAAPGTPVMRKDFLVDTTQVLEARAAGASGVLLIATMLDDGKLQAMLDCAFEHGMFVLLESFDEDDLRRSTQFLDLDGQLLIGVNTRNLRTLEVDGDRLRLIAPGLEFGMEDELAAHRALPPEKEVVDRHGRHRHEHQALQVIHRVGDANRRGPACQIIFHHPGLHDLRHQGHDRQQGP